MYQFILRLLFLALTFAGLEGAAAAGATGRLGDLDGNGRVDALDMAILQQAAVHNLTEGTSPCNQPDLADLDGSGALDAPDVAILAAILAGQPGTDRLPATPPTDFLGLIQGGYRLTWTDEAAPGETYLLERKMSDEEAFAPLARITAPACQFVDTAFQENRPCQYRLRLLRGGIAGLPAYCDTRVKAYTYIRITAYDAHWSSDPDMDDLTGHLRSMASYKDDPNLDMVFLGDAYGPDNSIYGWVDKQGAHYQKVREVNMGDPQTYDDFFQWVLENHPGQRYVVAYWAHGSGALNFLKSSGKEPGPATQYSVGLDLTSGDELTANEMHTVFANLARLTGRKVEVAFFCACLAQMMEHAFALQDGVEYVVAGESVVGCYGDVLHSLSELMGSPPEAIAMRNTDDQLNPYGKKDVVYSTVKTAEIPQLARLLDNLARKLKAFADGGPDRVSQVKAAVLKAQNMQFVPDNVNQYNAYLDIADLCAQLETLGDPAVAGAAQAVRTHLLDRVVRRLFIQNNSLNLYGNAHGLSIFHPTPAYPRYLAEYDQLLFARETAWDEYLKTLFSTFPASRSQEAGQ